MSLWDERDEPVLRYLNEHPVEHGILWTNWRSQEPHADLPHLTEAQFERAVETLHDAGYVAWEHQEGEGGGGRARQGVLVTGKGSRCSAPGLGSTRSGNRPSWPQSWSAWLSSPPRRTRRATCGGRGRRSPAMAPSPSARC
jgi:hypothetical protein